VGFLTHALLESRGVAHGFGVRDCVPPTGLLRPRQVHGAEVVRVGRSSWREPPSADAIVCRGPGPAVGVATADCVPVLLSSASGSCVAAVHAGWRGLGRGIVGAAVSALREAASGDEPLVAAIGPHIGPCCYEIDAPVVAALAPRFADALEQALRPARGGHHRLDLGLLVRGDLERCGIGATHVGALADACTHCDPRRFHSYRRDGPRAGRMLHFVSPRAPGGRFPGGGEGQDPPLDTAPGAT
jgi:YfiH family protein